MNGSLASRSRSQRSSTVGQQDAELLALLQEKKRRLAGRDRLLGFTEYVSPYYQADPFHIYVCEALDRVVSGDLSRLMIFAPPQHGKTIITSEHLPAFWLGRYPDDPVILASYGARRAYDNSRKARNIVEREEYRVLFGDLGPQDVAPVTTSDDSRAADEWALSHPHRGGVLAAGVGGAVTGFGAKLIIIDDPIKSWKEAQSTLIRDTAWEWYENTLLSRLREGGRMVLIITRWHQDDLAGRILAKERDLWTVLRFPALAETQEERDRAHEFLGLPPQQGDLIGRAPGEPLAPRRFSRETLEARRSTSGWWAIYQQIPRPTEGNLVKRQWLTIVDAVPADADIRARVRYWDKAGTSGGTGARTAGVRLALAKDGRIYVEHSIAGYFNAGERERVIRQTAELDGKTVKVYVEQEPGSGGLESAQATIRNLQGFSVYADRPTGDKDTRLEPFAAQAQAGNVYLKRGDWNMDYIEELIAIPNGARRDQGDATAGAYNMAVSKANSGFTPRIVDASGARKIGA